MLKQRRLAKLATCLAAAALTRHRTCSSVNAWRIDDGSSGGKLACFLAAAAA